LITALRIYDEINSHTTDEKLQKSPGNTARKRHRTNRGKEYSKDNIEKLFHQLNDITAESGDEEIICLTSGLFWASYSGKVKEELVCTEVSRHLGKLPEGKVAGIINMAVKKLLEAQKESFDAEKMYIDGEPFSWYDTPRKCMERVSHLNMWGETRSYRLSLDYGLSELLNICFGINPVCVIESLLKHETEICIKKAQTDDIPTLEYHVSEYIIQSFLTEYFPFHGKMSDKTWNFFEKTGCCKYLYIRIFFAISIVDELLDQTNEDKLNFDYIIKSFARLKLGSDEVAVVLGRVLNTIVSQTDYQHLITSFVAEGLEERSLIIFSLLAFIEPYDIRLKDFFDFIQTLVKLGRNREAETIEKLFLLYALQINPRLQNDVRTLIGINRETMEEYLVKKEQNEEEPSDIDVRKFVPVLRYIGEIFAHHLDKANDTSAFDKIVFSLKTDKTMIFNTKFPEKLTLFYYDLLFLLNTVNEIKNKTSGAQEILKFTQWYLPVCIDNLPNDFYGLGLKIIGVYAGMLSEKDKQTLLQRLTYLPMKALAASAIKEQSAQKIEIFREYIRQYGIDGHNKSIPAENFLSIGISLCIRCTEECNGENKADILECIVQINEKIKPVIIDAVKPILDYGIEYAKISSQENKKAFIDAMRNNFLPSQAYSLLEGYNV
jgi:hypothetical protein